MQRHEYLALRSHYEPQDISLVIIAESPPASGRYFYNPAGATSEPLFAAFMQQLGIAPATKDEGLREFQRRGYVLVDATYEPVNAHSKSARDDVIRRDYGLLRGGLERLIRSDRAIPIVLIKANVCRILEPKLKEDGFTLLNAGRLIYFPASGQQGKFHQQFGEILRSADLDQARYHPA